MSESPRDDGNGRVTLAVINSKLDRVITDVEMLRREMAGVSTWCTESKTRWVQHDKEHTDLERDISNKRNLGDAVTGILAVVLGALGIAYKP